MAAALSDRSKVMGDLLEALRVFYPNYTWKSKLHSNMIRGTIGNDPKYTIMIIYFQMKNCFEVCVRGVDVNCRSVDPDVIEAMKDLEAQLNEKKKVIEEIIEELTKERLEDSKNG